VARVGITDDLLRSLGLATDLLALRGVAQLEQHPTRLVVRTPSEPEFWSGNMLVLFSPPGGPEQEAALFRAEFPEARHLRIAWDTPDPDPEALRDAWEPLGAEVLVGDVLAREGPPPTISSPQGYDLRELASEEDWEQSLQLGLLMAVAEGYAEGPHLAFLRRRIEGRRRQAKEGHLRWWGAFRGSDLAAHMGLVEGEVDGRSMARFQDVETHPDHRRRGLSTALLAKVAGAARAPRLVIQAQPDSDAGRIYRRAGFKPVERCAVVERRGC
jgi:GNAT superfamily N-acetyltransferase